MPSSEKASAEEIVRYEKDPKNNLKAAKAFPVSD
jgi:hypothetical protein